VNGAANLTAVEAFRGAYELQRLRALAEREWAKMDALLLPTTPTIYKVDDVLTDPVRLNSTSAATRTSQTSWTSPRSPCPRAFAQMACRYGVTFLAPAFADDSLAQAWSLIHSASPNSAARRLASTSPWSVRICPASR
jgi:allophanate hydrolase